MTKLTDIATVIIAAGQGKRMKSDTPKVLHKVGGLPLLFHVVNISEQLESSHNILVLSKPVAEIAGNSLSEFSNNSSTIKIQEKPQGTAHAAMQARANLAEFEGVVLVLYGDTPFAPAALLTKLADKLAENPDAVAALLAIELEDPTGYGRLVMDAADSDNIDNVREIIECHEATEQQKQIRICNSGIMALRSPICWQLLSEIDNHNKKQEYYLTDLVAIARKHKVKVITEIISDPEIIEDLLGINDREQLANAELQFQSKKRAEIMRKGVTLIGKEDIFFSYDTEIAADVMIQPYVWFGEGVRVASGTEIRSFCHLEQVSIGSNCTIGPFARLRPNTKLEDNVRIGNFVEVKASEIGSGSKINHLSYIGDSSMGMNCNIGAGTITCNYDGYRKYKSEFGDNVFVGSNSAIISPVNMGDNAIIAAGSVIRQDVKQDELAIARAEQENIEGGASKFRKSQEQK